MKSPRVSRMLTLLGAVAMICAGCSSGQQKTAELERKPGDSDKRIAELTATVAKFQQDEDALKGDLQKMIKETVAKEVEARMSADMDKIVSAGIEKRLGTDGEIGPKIRETVKEVVDAAEAKRQEERRQQQGGFQQNMAEQRQRWESERLDNLAKDLNLNDAQKKQLRDSQTAMQAKAMDGARKLMESGNADPSAILQGVKELQADHFAAVKAFLTDAQYQSYTNRQSNMFSFFGGMGGMGGMGGFGRGGRQRGPGRLDQQSQPQQPPLQPQPTAPAPAPAAL